MAINDFEYIPTNDLELAQKLLFLNVSSFQVFQGSGKVGSYDQAVLKAGLLSHSSELGWVSGPNEDDGAAFMMTTSFNFYKNSKFQVK